MTLDQACLDTSKVFQEPPPASRQPRTRAIPQFSVGAMGKGRRQDGEGVRPRQRRVRAAARGCSELGQEGKARHPLPGVLQGEWSGRGAQLEARVGEPLTWVS